MTSFQERFVRNLQLELKFFQKKFSIFSFPLLIIYAIEYFVINIGDIQGFFLGDNSLIPKDWTFFQNRTNVQIISILFPITIYSLIWIIVSFQQSKDVGELASVIQQYGVPSIENQLKNFINRRLKQRYNLSNDIRASIFLPVRVGFFRWRLQMISRTENIQEKELDALFAFNEGVLGYTFMRAKKYHVEFVDLSTRQNIPSTYVHLSQDNRNLIEQNIKAVTVLAFSQCNSIMGLLALDTTNNLDLQALQNRGLHNDALNWMRCRKRDINLLWRMTNNV